MFFRDSTNAEQVTAVAGGGSHHSAAFVNGMNCLSPDDENDEFILHIDDLIVEPEDANGSGFSVDAERSLLPSKQPCTAASTETQSHPITGIGSELEALIATFMDKGNDIASIFYAGKAPTSHAMLSNVGHCGMCSYPVANIAPQNTSFAPQNTGAGHSGMCSYPVANFDANTAPQNTLAAHRRMASFAIASIGADNAPQNTMAAHVGITNHEIASVGANNAPWNMVSCAAASIGANNAPRNTGASYRVMTSFGASNLGAYNAPQTMMGARSRMASSGGSSFDANNSPPQNIVGAHSGTTSFAVASFDATTNATQNMVSQLPPVAPSSNFGGGEWPDLNTTIHDEGIFDLDDLFTD